MSNHSYLIDPAQAAGAAVGDSLQLDGAEAHHAVSVKRARPGEQLDLLDGAGLRLVVEVTDTAKDLLRVTVLARQQEQPPAHPVTLVQALAKGDRDLQAVESAVELGVFAVRPWQADRSIVRWTGSKTDKALAKWRAQVRAAQKQSRRSFAPEVLDPATTKQLAGIVREQVAAGDLVLVLHEQATASVGELLGGWLPQAGADTRVVLIVGPEGGISDAEVDALRAAGAHPALLGEHVLRASTAGPAALVLVRHLLGEL